MTRNVAVIAAGGHGRRLGLDKPKSLILYKGSTLLELLIKQLLPLEFDLFIIFCDRSEYINDILSITENDERFILISDHGFNSTFQLMKISSLLCKDDDLYFFYGHAPRPTEDLSKLMSSDFEGKVVLSLFDSSSRRDVISTSNSYAEPPFRIPSNISGNLSENCWSTFVKNNTDCTEYISYPSSPHEFNTTEEKELYELYLDGWST